MVSKRQRKKRTKARKRAAAMICPVDGARLVKVSEQKWSCPTPGCDVRCWSGDTSTPCTAKTAELRGMLHYVFDPLWKAGDVFAPRSAPEDRHRKQAYKWLAAKLGISGSACHIGYFDADTCRRAMSVVLELVDRRKNANDSETLLTSSAPE